MDILEQVIVDMVNHFKAELDNLVLLAGRVAGLADRLGDATTCLYLASIGNSLIHLVNDAVLFIGAVRKDVSERVIARVLMLRADKGLVEEYVNRGWVDSGTAGRAREALDAEESRLAELYNQLSSIMNAKYDELRSYAESKLDEFARIYKQSGCDELISL